MKANQEKFWIAEPIQQLIKNKEDYDIVIAIPILYDGQLALYHHLGLPVIFFFPGGSNFLVNKYVANPNLAHSAPIPTLNAESGSFISRLITTSIIFAVGIFDKFFIEPVVQETMENYIPNSPKLWDLQKNVSLVFVNSHLSIEPTRLVNNFA